MTKLLESYAGPVFTGEVNEITDLFAYAEKVTKETVDKMRN